MVISGQEAEVGGGAGPVLHGAGERGDVEAGGRRGRGVEDDRALLADPVRRGATATATSPAAAAVVLGGAGDDLPWPGAEEDLTAIAAELRRSTSTVSREVARNNRPNGYRAARADRLA